MGPTDAAALLLEVAESRPPTLGPGRLVCVDGPAGSGKTTLADAVAALRPGARVVHMDDLYDGWNGLPHLADQLTGLLRPLADGEPGCYRRYDWFAGCYAETVDVPPGDLLVLEGGHGRTRTSPPPWPGCGRRRSCGCGAGWSASASRSGTGGASGWSTRTCTSPGTGWPGAPTCTSTGPG